jgi:hypothetical protein
MIYPRNTSKRCSKGMKGITGLEVYSLSNTRRGKGLRGKDEKCGEVLELQLNED